MTPASANATAPHDRPRATRGSNLVIQTSFLGDMVLTTPLLAYLAMSSDVDVVCTPAASVLLENHPAVRNVIVYDKRGEDRGTAGAMRLAMRLRENRYDAAYLAQGSVRSGAIAFMARIPDRVGFVTSAGRWFYTTRVVPIDNTHHAMRLLALGTRDPGRIVSNAEIRPRLYPGERERQAVDEVLGTNAMSDEPIVVMAPGSVWATKRWPYFPALAGALRHSARIAVVGTESDRPLALEIVAATTGQAIDATGRLSLLASAELIGRATLLVTNDSAPLHLASAMNTPTVAVFGPTVPEFGFGPLAERSVVAGHESLACRPCDRHGPQRCPLGHWRCMREITPDRVASLALGLLTSRIP
jgi:heptosyltransferase II